MLRVTCKGTPYRVSEKKNSKRNCWRKSNKKVFTDLEKCPKKLKNENLKYLSQKLIEQFLQKVFRIFFMEFLETSFQKLLEKLLKKFPNTLLEKNLKRFLVKFPRNQEILPKFVNKFLQQLPHYFLALFTEGISENNLGFLFSERLLKESELELLDQLIE